MYSLENDTNRHTGVHKSTVYVLTGFLHPNKNLLVNVSTKRTSFQFYCVNFYCNYVRAFNWLVIEKNRLFMFEREKKKVCTYIHFATFCKYVKSWLLKSLFFCFFRCLFSHLFFVHGFVSNICVSTDRTLQSNGFLLSTKKMAEVFFFTLLNYCSVKRKEITIDVQKPTLLTIVHVLIENYKN
jgi:hypothetical protein